MTSTGRRRGLFALGLTFLLFAAGCLAVRAAGASDSDRISVIVNSSVPVDAIDLATLRGIFGMNLKTWNDKTPVHVFVFPSDSRAHELFCRDFLGLYPYQLERSWDRQLFAGLGTHPTVVGSRAEMIEKIRTVPGAIGYVENTSSRDMDGVRRVGSDKELKVVR